MLVLSVRFRAFILSFIAIVIIVLSICLLGTTRFDTPAGIELVRLDDGWTVSRGLTVWEADDIRDSSIGIVNSGDEIVISRVLPDTDISPATISFRTLLSSVKVSIDDELIYSFGDSYAGSDRMLPKIQHFIRLPDDFQNRTITIAITAHENDALSGLSPIYFGNYEDISTYLVQSSKFSLVIGVFLVVFGFLLLILAPFLVITHKHDYSISFSALTSIMMGIYILCFNDLLWYFSDNPDLYTFLEYFSLFMIPAVILGFILAAHQIPFRKLGITLLSINLGFALITSLLHIINAVHICHFVTVLHILAVIEGVFVIAVLIFQVVRRKKDSDESYIHINSTNMLISGLVLFLGCSVIDIIKFNILKFSRMGEVNANINFMTVGALVFMVCLLLNYFYHCIEYISESTEKVQLEGLAYSDSLTGLSNRAYCEQTLANLKGAFTVISFDLDYLKYTNDNYGHAEGDKLISGFADILEGSFTDASLIGRMGGDEFIVVLPFIDTERTDRDIACFNDLMSYRNSKESKLRFSASWGLANSKDKEFAISPTAQAVYLLADQRMYVMKKQHHNQSLGRLYDDLISNIMKKGGGELL